MDVTRFLDLKTFHWERPAAANPRLAAPVSATATTLLFTNPPLDEDDAVVTRAFLMGITNADGFTEQVLVGEGYLNFDAQTANFTVGDRLTGGTSGAEGVILKVIDNGTTGTIILGFISGTFQNNETITDDSGGSATADGTVTNCMSADGLTATNVLRGLDVAGLDITTENSALAAKHGQDSKVFCNISALLFTMMEQALKGNIASGDVNWRIGRDKNEDIVIYAANGDANLPFWKYDSATNQWVFSNDGVSSSPFGTGAGVSGGDGIDVTAGVISQDLAASDPGLEISSAKLQLVRSVIQDNDWTYGSDGGSADALTLTLSPALTAYTAGQKFIILVANTNTGATTLNINGLGVKTIKKNISSDLAAGDIQAGQVIEVVYDGTNFQLTSNYGTGFIENALIDAKGDLIIGSAADTPSILSIGAVTEALRRNSSDQLAWQDVYYGEVVSTVSDTSSGDNNVDTTITVGFQAKLVVVFYKIIGSSSSTTKNSGGILITDGTTPLLHIVDYANVNDATARTTDDHSPNQAAGNPSVGTDGASGNVKVTLSVNSVTSTQVVIRSAFERIGHSDQGDAEFSVLVLG